MYSSEMGAVTGTYTDQGGDTTEDVPVLIKTVRSEKDSRDIVYGDAGELAVMKKYVANPLPRETFTIGSTTWTVTERIGDDSAQWLLAVVKDIIPYS